MRRAIIEYTGVYVCYQWDQTSFLPQGDMSEIYDVNASYRLHKVITKPGTNYGQICATNRHPDSLF